MFMDTAQKGVWIIPQNPGIILCMHKECIPGLSLLLWEWPGGEARGLHTPQVPIHAHFYSSSSLDHVPKVEYPWLSLRSEKRCVSLTIHPYDCLFMPESKREEIRQNFPDQNTHFYKWYIVFFNLYAKHPLAKPKI